MTFQYTVQDQLGDKDLSKTRYFSLEGTTNRLYAQQSDPYGFWRLHIEKGSLPSWLDQDFNEWGQVMNAVDRYMRQRKEAQEELARKEAEARPTVAIKPGFNRDGTKVA